MIKRAYRFRFYPNPEQATELARTFGCARWVYNAALAERTRAYKDDGVRLTYNDTSALLTQWKHDPQLAFLGEVSSVPLQQSLRHLNTAFMRFFSKQSKYPRFKKKGHSKDSAEYTYRAFSYAEPSEDWEPKKRYGQAKKTPGQAPVLKLAKMDEPLDVHFHRKMPTGTPSTVTISRDSAGRYFASLLYEDTAPASPEPVNTVAGIDMGQSETVVIADDSRKASRTAGLMPRAKLEKELACAQRDYARKQKGSKNQAKAAAKIARIHAKIADARRSHLHTISRKVVDENQVIGLEDLDVRNMTATGKGTLESPGADVRKKAGTNRRNLDVGYRILRTQIEYKAQWAGREVVAVDRYYPSSKLCSTQGCDYIAPAMPLSIRSWQCPKCGTHHDRDSNAAINIQAAATAASACGDGVRRRRKTRKGQPVASVSEAGSSVRRPTKPRPSGRGS